ncbi:Membrane protein, putative [Mycoplasma leachii 99/014/6]|uniref:protein translocase SecDF, variant type n=1 Tax=Mycoplasma leachii TaxID=2105 RepID=UPI0002177181|nr:protein translocase SecDF, variant type [Mycoplasma leachii]CBV67045.1 Membrane protein, putative [Mycoplasma leachii 99/014/6]
MKNRLASFKKILRFIIMLILILTLLTGIGFSSYKIANNTLYGSKFVGGYQALVGVYDKTKNQEEEIPNGDAFKGAKSLEKKLSPFSDNTIETQQAGLSRVFIKASKKAYSNNQDDFKNAIERTGGLFILDKNYQDIFFNEELMKIIGVGEVYSKNSSDKRVNKKLTLEEFLGEARVESLQPANFSNKNSPFVSFNLKNEYLKNLIDPKKNKDSNSLTMITSVGYVIETLRTYYKKANSTNKQIIEKYLNTYFNQIIKPIQDYISSHASDTLAVKTLKDLFAIEYSTTTTEGTSGNLTIQRTSLVDSKINKWWKSNQTGKIENTNDLKYVLFGTNNLDKKNDRHIFRFTNSVNKYLYDANASEKDFIKDDKGNVGKYYNKLKISSDNSISQDEELDYIDKVSNKLISIIMTEILFKKDTTDKEHVVNRNLDQTLFRNNVLLHNNQISPDNTRIVTTNPAIVTDRKTQITKLYIPVWSNTMAKQVESDILQTSLGYTFKVLSIKEFSADITNIMLIITLGCLVILALAVLVFMLFSYRLLGLFAIVLAAISASLTMLVPIIFNMAIGPEIFMIMFVGIGLILDASIIYFENLKTHIYKEKLSPESSFKISNKDTLTILLDTSFIILIPNILLFIFGSGALKNLATISVINILIVILFVILGLRLLTWIVLKSKLFTKYPWLLPLNTLKNSQSTWFNDLMLSLYSSRIENLNSKLKLTTKDLIKLKKIKDKYNFYLNKQQQIIKSKKENQLKKDQVKLESVNNYLLKLEEKREKLTTKDLIKLKKIKDKYNFYLNKQQQIIKSKKENQLKKDQVKLESVNNYLLKLEEKREKLTTKDLIKLKKIKDKYNFYLNKQQQIIKSKKEETKEYKKIQAKLDLLNKRLLKFENKISKKTNKKSLIKSLIKNNLIKQEYLKAKIDQLTSNQVLESLENKNNQRKIFKVNKIFTIIFIICTFLGAIIGFTIGPNYSSSFGKSISVIAYGQKVNDIYDNLNESIRNYKQFDKSTKRGREIVKMGEYLERVKFSQDAYMKSILNKNYTDLDKVNKNRWASYVVAQIYKEIVNKNYVSLWKNPVSYNKYFRASVDVDYGYDFVDTNNKDLDNKQLAYVSFRIVNAKDNRIINIFEKLFVRDNLQNPDLSIRYDHDDNNSSSGIINLVNIPVTAYGEIKNIAIIFAITLLALLIYILIRFKWTYFVALALTLVLTIVLVSSLVIIFRVPVGIEILSAILAVLSFTIITCVLFLGKGKSIIKSKDNKTFSEMFEKEILAYSNKKATRYQVDNKIHKLKVEYKNNKKNLIKQQLESKNIKSILAKMFFKLKQNLKLRFNKKHNQLYKNLKLEIKENKKILKQHKKHTKIEIDLIANNNAFLKETFINVFKFGMSRSFLVTTIYIIYALIISFGMYSIIGMGLTISIGILIASLVSLLIALPIWIWLEKKRMIHVLGYRYYVQNFKINQEEQIINGIND